MFIILCCTAVVVYVDIGVYVITDVTEIEKVWYEISGTVCKEKQQNNNNLETTNLFQVKKHMPCFTMSRLWLTL